MVNSCILVTWAGNLHEVGTIRSRRSWPKRKRSRFCGFLSFCLIVTNSIGMMGISMCISSTFFTSVVKNEDGTSSKSLIRAPSGTTMKVTSPFRLDFKNYETVDLYLSRIHTSVDTFDAPPTSATRPCALLFFGLARNFARIAYPSIRRYIIDSNAKCDVYVHTYNVTEDNGNRFRNRKNRRHATTVKPDEMTLLASGEDFIMFESEVDFLQQHNLSYYRIHFPEPSSWEFPASMDNMIRQWHSIQSVWNLMHKYEEKHQFTYERVGLLRSDVLYTHPIDIFDGDAVIPSMMYICMVWCGYNDRLFYGLRNYAETWATHRFGLVESYLEEQPNNPEYDSTEEYEELRGLHSENFMRYMMLRRNIPLQIKDLCFMRIRSWGEICKSDCDRD